MAFYLGSFSNSLFSGASNVMQLYGMYQGIAQAQEQEKGAAMAKEAMQQDMGLYQEGKHPQAQNMGYTRTTEGEYPTPGPDTPGYTSSTSQPATKAPEKPPPGYTDPGKLAAGAGTRERQGYNTPSQPNQLAGGEYPTPGPGTFPAAPPSRQAAAAPPQVDEYGRPIPQVALRSPTWPTLPAQTANAAPAAATPTVDEYGRPVPAVSGPAIGQQPGVTSDTTPRPSSPIPWQLPPGLTPPRNVPYAQPAAPPPTDQHTMGQTNVAPPDQYTVQTPAEAQTGLNPLVRPQYPPTPPPVPTTQAGPSPPPNPVAAAQTGIQPVIRSLTPAEPAGPPEAPIQGAPMGPVSQAPPSPMRRVLDALNPISSAQAAEAPPGGTGGTGGTGTAVATTGTAGGTGTTTPAQPAAPSANPPSQHTAPGPVAVQGRPGQVQSESTQPVNKPMIRTDALERVLREQPELGRRLIQIAEEHQISPHRLALHWELENGLREQWQVGADGELGMLQIMPATWRNADPQGKYDPRTTDGALHVASLVIWDADGKFGKDTPSSLGSYRAGPAGIGHAAQYGMSQNDQRYFARAYPGTPITQAMLSDYKEGSAARIVQAADAGPDAVLKEIVNSAPQNMSMTDMWRRAEAQLMYAAAMRGDWQGVQHAQDFVFQQSHQGAMSNLMAAHQQLIAGNVTGAASALAKAHAFFPDGSYGRFGIGPDGKLYGEQYNEITGKRIGNRMQITPEVLQYQLMATSRPADYVKSVQAQQKINYDHAYQLATIQKDYYGIGERAHTAELDRQQRREASELGSDTRLAIKAASEGARQPGQQQDLNHVAADDAKRYPVDDLNAPSDQAQLPAYQQQRAREQEIYNSVRRVPIERGGVKVGDGQAAIMAKGLLTGKYNLRDEGNGTHAILEKGSNTPLGHIDTGLAVRMGLAGSKPSGQQAALQSPVGAQASQLAAMQAVQGQPQRGVFA